MQPIVLSVNLPWIERRQDFTWNGGRQHDYVNFSCKSLLSSVGLSYVAYRQYLEILIAH